MDGPLINLRPEFVGSVQDGPLHFQDQRFFIKNRQSCDLNPGLCLTTCANEQEATLIHFPSGVGHSKKIELMEMCTTCSTSYSTENGRSLRI